MIKKNFFRSASDKTRLHLGAFHKKNVGENIYVYVGK